MKMFLLFMLLQLQLFSFGQVEIYKIITAQQLTFEEHANDVPFDEIQFLEIDWEQQLLIFFTHEKERQLELRQLIYSSTDDLIKGFIWQAFDFYSKSYEVFIQEINLEDLEITIKSEHEEVCYQLFFWE